MFKFIKGKGPHPTAERQKLQKELFSYRRTLQHGFPHKPTALAWDPTLRLLCIGTVTGAVKVFGQPGVEFYGQHQNPIAVIKAVFLPNQGRVVTLCDDNSLHLWEVNKSSLVEVKSQALEGKLKTISTICVESIGKHLLLGTEGGNIYVLDLATFTMTPDIIYQDIVMNEVPRDYKLNPGAVEAIFEQPNEPNNILIGYNRGLIVLWNRSENKSTKTFVSNQQLESICWHDDGKTFTTSHNDGSYCTWDLDQPDKPISEPITTYGPYPCRAIPKIIRRELHGKSLTVFSGGLNRSAGSEKYTVTVIQDQQHVVFDFTSKVIDFLLIDSNASQEQNENGDEQNQPDTLVVLAEEELVVIDLQTKDWRMINLPYLVSLHASSVTCSQHVADVPEELWEQLKDAGRAQSTNLFSQRQWPIDGGELLCSKGDPPHRDLLLTGHEDGTVRFWDAGGVTLTPIYKFSTAHYFVGDELDEAQPEPDEYDEDDWPPFRKIGVFDPYSDDPRLAVKKASLCPLSGRLIVAGTAGHLIVAKFDTEVLEAEVPFVKMNIVNDRDGFVWKGHNQLDGRQGTSLQPRGFQASSILQLHPPAAITACVLQADWGLVAAGTAHGLALYDYVQKKPILVKCTLNPNDLTGTGDTPISRRKSFKKSLRESFRRLRKGRSQRRPNEPAPAPVRKPDEPQSPLEAKPVERQIEARPVDDSMSSFVRCLYFARTFLLNAQTTTPTLWAGTNNGTVYTFMINVPSSTRRENDDVTCNIAKEIQLKHRAPVIAIAVLDGSNKPLPEPLEVERGVSPLPDTTLAHRVIIASEEQFKIFTLPQVKAFGKFKLTALDGSRVRRMAFGTFQQRGEGELHSEIDLLCLTNIGECHVFSIPDLKRQLSAAAIKREDINGISSLVFTKKAEALYLHSSSELQRFALAANHGVIARCYLSLPPGAREEEVIVVPTEEKEEGGEGEKGEEEAVHLIPNGVVAPPPSLNDPKVAELLMALNGLNGSSDEVKENGGGENSHNVTVTSSVGDITIDSVKNYLGSVDDLNRRTSGLTVTKTVTVTNQDGAVMSSTTTTTQDTVESVMDGAELIENKKNSVSDLLLRAPLALAEELDTESHLNGDA